MSQPVPLLHKFLWGALVLLLTGIVAAALVREIKNRQEEAPKEMFAAPRGPARFLDQLGRPVRLSDFDGHVWIADFIFTRCLGPCPLMTQNMEKLQAELPKDVLLISFTVDPKYDRPEVLKEYAEKFHADSDRWRFLTGKQKDIYRVAEGFKLTVPEEEQTRPDQIDHSTRFVLVDRRGACVGAYLGVDEDHLKRLREDAARLVQK